MDSNTSSKGGKRRRKELNKLAAQKRWRASEGCSELDQNQDNEPETESFSSVPSSSSSDPTSSTIHNTIDSATPDHPVKVASQGKLQLMRKPSHPAADTASKWILMDINQQNTLLANVACPSCFSTDCIVQRKGGADPKGFSEPVFLQCTVCPYKSDPVQSSGFTEGTGFEINMLMTVLAAELGKGHAALQKVQEVLGLNCMSKATYHKHAKSVHAACGTTAQSVQEDVAECVRNANIDSLSPDGVTNITVSYDGTWHKRGFTSKYGVGVAIDVQTGLLLDYEVLSTYCHACSLAESCLGKDSAPFQQWKEEHTDCCANFGGSSKAMEAEAAKRIWQRSVDKFNLRYTNILSDGDASTFSVLQKLNPYGDDFPVQKMDCVNHADKRLGTALRKAAIEHKLGGRGVARLTEAKMKTLQRYFGRAIRSHVGDPEAMHRAIWASLLHSMSTDENPQHHYCPHGIESWCRFNKAEAVGAPFPPHDATTISAWITPEIGKVISPIYKRMTDPNLLQRMSTGATQNANESFNNMIWALCPKTTFVGKDKVQAAVDMAMTKFNAGARALLDRMRHLNVMPAECQIKMMDSKDVQRIQLATVAAQTSEIERRKVRKDAQRQALLDLEAVEGMQYGSGEF